MMATNLDKNGLEILPRIEAIRLLTTKQVGRLSVTMRALPTVLPVNYVVDREAIVFRTGSGTKMQAATRNAVVAFEVDEIDEATRTGWSVVVIGTATPVVDPDEVARLERLELDSWVTQARLENFVRIPIVHVAGRRIMARADANVAAPALSTEA